jgi:Protein of unknown function (DUF4230)
MVFENIKRLMIPLIAIFILLALLLWFIMRSSAPNIETLASASLKGLREQNRLTIFAANYSTVVTSEQRRFGLSAKKTLIMQGMVRYDVDMTKFAANDVRWDETTNTLYVRIPDVEPALPQIDLNSIQEYGEGGILTALTDAEQVLDKTNREKGLIELSKQAKGTVPMRLARDAARRAVAQNFSVPLKAAGITAKVDAKFGDEMVGKVDTRWDLSTPIEEIIGK